MKEIRAVLDELKKELGMERRIRVELREMKVKAASVSIKKGVIRLNRYIVSNSEEKCIRYLILHELAHLKLGSTIHGDEFYKVIYSVMDRNDVEDAERRIVKSLMKLNGLSPF
ncbi:MAG: hypothetical protein DSO07_10745 [Thermoproteota archaeon]|jgi:predicted metal-dependent hydrolase|uniref:M48 family peptidase n=1 Tax=Candidatus Methanodesulfokora washburnensis TaxID=2478471 RepID=A0A3R9PFC4_9CREN|nr:M48 family metallopeptidase [Candidatus Methanodesulfokores washburnensis]RSN72887.1 M48 family peptidase [Candidatus Methanodesulfokores washburnensis]TDA39205.1 MAG: hypothetical protein DSO07_10745 [Candidatus Korarchaeota archaeon]